MSIAHRGASGFCPENTIEAFHKAFDLGCNGIELDVHLSADGEILVIHDDTINRTTTGNGLVQAITLTELRASGITQIPTLEEVIAITPKNCLINIELKSADTAIPVSNLVKKCVSEHGWNMDSFLISSFDWLALKAFADYNPKIPLGVLTETDLDLAISFAMFINAKYIHPQYHLLTAQKVQTMKENGFKIITWTVNEANDIQLIQSFDVDGIITDFPDRI